MNDVYGSKREREMCVVSVRVCKRKLCTRMLEDKQRVWVCESASLCVKEPSCTQTWTFWVSACMRACERERKERDIERTLQKKDWVLYVLATAENLYWRTENECEMDRFLFHAYLITEAVTDGPSASDQSLSIVFAAKFDQKILSRSSQLISKPCSLPFTFKFLSI